MARTISLFVIVILFQAGAARAGTPLPNPPFEGGGFVAPSSDVLRREERVNRLLINYLKKRTTCDRVAVTSLQLAYTPANPSKVAAIQELWTACNDRNNHGYLVNRDRLLARGTPACLDQAGIDNQRAAIDGLIAVLTSIIYCDDGGASPDPVTGLNIPDKKQETIGETELAKIVLRAHLGATKCYSNAAKYALRTGGVFDDRTVAKFTACLAKVATRVEDAVADLDQTNKLPDCLPPEMAVAAGAVATNFASASTAAIYCTSPSGAFVDGPATM